MPMRKLYGVVVFVVWPRLCHGLQTSLPLARNFETIDNGDKVTKPIICTSARFDHLTSQLKTVNVVLIHVSNVLDVVALPILNW